MSKNFKHFLIIVCILVLSWFFKIVPSINFNIQGLTGCNQIKLTTLKFFIIPNQSNTSPIHRTVEPEKPISIISWGSCEFY